METVNFVSLPLTLLMSLVGGPVLLRRAGYPLGKIVFGTLTCLMVLLGVWGVISAIQAKTGLQAVPLGWLVPLAATVAAWRWRDRL
ncbi:MAG: hypothetical protein ACM3Q1_05005 [Bacteroidales bacterium]